MDARDHAQVAGVECERGAYARSLLLVVRANERAAALGRREYGISPARREPRRRSRKRAGASGPLGRRQAFRRFRSRRAARDAGYPCATRGEGQHAARRGRLACWGLRRNLSGGAFWPIWRGLVRDLPRAISLP